MTELDEEVYGVLAGMPVLPRDVGNMVLGRLVRIERALDDEVIDEGTILVQFDDCAGDTVVLAMTVRPGSAFLDISTSEDAIAISNGYSFRMGERGVNLAVDRDHPMTQVDHDHLVGRWLATERALTMMTEARVLMRTHPAFSCMN